VCVLSMMDYLETSRNLWKPAAAVSGRFRDVFNNNKILKKRNYTNKQDRRYSDPKARNG
jgi:hypothetical protein